MRLVVALALIGALGAPAAADPDAPDRAELCWRYDFGIDAVVPVGGKAYEDSTSFGGRFVFRSTRGLLTTQVDLDVLSRDNGPAMEQVGYRGRALAGARWRREQEPQRAIEVRAVAGLEVAGMDRISTDWLADRYALGFAAEVGIENRNELGWGTVALRLGLGLSVQPFGGDDRATYVGADVLFGFSVSF